MKASCTAVQEASFVTLWQILQMVQIKFGTDGWRAIIAREFTNDNVARVAAATAEWAKARSEGPAVVIGHDCRFAGEMFAEVTAKVLCAAGVKSVYSKGYVSTPMVSLGANKLGCICRSGHYCQPQPACLQWFQTQKRIRRTNHSEEISWVESRIPENRNTRNRSGYLGSSGIAGMG